MPESRSIYWTLAAARSWFIIGLASALCLTIWGCQASTTVTGAKAQASSITRTTTIRTAQPPAPPTIRIRVGPRPEPTP